MSMSMSYVYILEILEDAAGGRAGVQKPVSLKLALANLMALEVESKHLSFCFA